MKPMFSRKGPIAAAIAAFVLQPVVASAQAPCITEDEVSAMAIYSVPNLVQAVHLRCDAQLSPNGFLARRGASFVGRYTALQGTTWPKAKSGLLKYGASKARTAQQDMGMFINLPDNAVRPLVDALIVQEASAKIEPRQCGRIERVIQAMSPIDPEITGSLLGVLIGFAAPDDQPICPRRI